MRIKQVLERTVPIKSEMKNAFIAFSEMTVSVVAVVSDRTRNGIPIVGYGFNSNGRYAQGGILRDRMIPRLLKAEEKDLLSDDGQRFDPTKAWRAIMQNEKPGGHGDRSVAAGVLDMALWDLAAKIEDVPLFRLIADRFNGGVCDDRVFVYAAGGYYYPNDSLSRLRDEIKHYSQLGYTAVKIKVGGAPLADDLMRVEAVLGVLGPGQSLAVDANARMSESDAMAYLKAFENHNLNWFEEPCDPLDFETLARVSASATMPLATGENLFSHQEVQNLLRYGGLRSSRDVLQMDPALSYGLTEYLRSLEVLSTMGWSRRRCIPHGGHQMALHLASGLCLGGNESYPDVFQPFGGFADETAVSDGHVTIPPYPGIGIEAKQNLYRIFRDLT